MKKILITGGNGQLGRSLKQQLKKNPLPAYEFVFTDEQELDITDRLLVETYFFDNKFEYVINCAAYTAVDKAESEADKAKMLNTDAVKYLAKSCDAQGAVFIHISTDYVFSGEEESPRKETDPAEPIGVYGKTKLEGEHLAFEENKRTYIIRTAWLYSPYGSNFVKTMLKLFDEKKEINVVNDQFGSPTNALDLAEAILTIIQNKKKGSYGIYHYSNEGQCNWYEFAEEIKKLSGAKTLIHSVPTSAYFTFAKRPKYSLLDKTKIKEVFGISVPEWKESLKTVFEEGYFSKNTL